ncbi:hypothetical protein ABGB14_34865 [Nonomuraea sp. B10E15]|uniref:hypothetical protein n=1 Tax=Nonomuraea sp. B10E15 TaxID=3153560 RepID=UPI00325E5A92
MLRAWLVRQAATVTFRSAIRLVPPDRAVSEGRNCGTQPITSRTWSPMSMRGSMAATRLRRSISDGGSLIALSLVVDLPLPVHPHVGVGRQASAQVLITKELDRHGPHHRTQAPQAER